MTATHLLKNCRTMEAGKWWPQIAIPTCCTTWHPQFVPPIALELPYTGPSEASVSWQLPGNLEPGRYRLRTKGVANPGGPWEGVSGVVEIAGTPGRCP